MLPRSGRCDRSVSLVVSVLVQPALSLDTIAMSVVRQLSSLLSRVSNLFPRWAPAAKVHASHQPFDETTFRHRERFRANYHDLCVALADVLDFHSLLDLGCANGFVLQEMTGLGKDVHGIEVSAAVLPLLANEIRSRVRIADATTLGKVGAFDLVTCIEVAEHVQPKESSALVKAITDNATKWAYFTAASPYQPGHGHINCRQQFFWMNEFRKRGWDIEWDTTAELIRRIEHIEPALWLPMNSMIFRRRL